MDLQQIRGVEGAALIQIGEQQQDIHRQAGQQPQEQGSGVRRASAKLEKDRHLRRLPVRKEVLLIPVQPAQEVHRPAGELGDAAAAPLPLLQHQIDESSGHQALELHIGRIPDVGGETRRQLLCGGVVAPLDRGDLLRPGGRGVSVDHADPAAAALEGLIKREEVVGIGEIVLHTVLAEEEVAEKAGIVSAGLHSRQRRVQLCLLHPGVGAGREGGRRAVEPLAAHLPLQLRLKLLDTEARREGPQARGLIQVRQGRLGVHGEICLVAAALQQDDIRPRPGEDRQQLQLIMAHVPGIEDLGQRLAAQHVDDPLELVVEPAHVFHVGIAEHIVVSARPAHIVQGGIHGRHHSVPLPVRHPGQPFFQPLGEKIPVHLETGPHHLIEIGQVVGRGVGDAPVDDDAGPAGRLIVAAQKSGHRLPVPGDPAEKHAGPAPFRERAEIIIQLCRSRLLKHRSPVSFSSQDLCFSL